MDRNYEETMKEVKSILPDKLRTMFKDGNITGALIVRIWSNVAKWHIKEFTRAKNEAIVETCEEIKKYIPLHDVYINPINRLKAEAEKQLEGI